MGSTYQSLFGKELIKSLPKFLGTAIQYEVVMGSIAYGVATDASDMDIYGFAIHPCDYVFSHLRGGIAGLDEQGPQFAYCGPK